MKLISILLACTCLVCACHSQKQKDTTPTEVQASELNEFKKKAKQIGQYIVETFEDSKGNLWFGTLEKGIAKYDGENPVYLTTKDGLPSNRVTAMVEDEEGNLWFGTGAGLSKYDGQNFSNYSQHDGLCSNMVSLLYIDKSGTFWIGTWGGLCTFDGKDFENFELPDPDISTPVNEDTRNLITELMEDSEGNLWFGRDGFGAYKYDGTEFTHVLKRDGLYSNNIIAIQEDKDGNFWFSTRVAERDNADPSSRFGEGGITFFDGKDYKHFPEIEGFNNSDCYGMYRDGKDNIWISTQSDGLYKYNGKKFEHFEVPVSVMGMLEDSHGNFWLGAAGGLYLLKKNGEVVNVTMDGPWPKF